MKLTKNQKGLAAVEAILVIIVLGIIGFTGWFVWHSKQITDKTLNTVSSSTVQPKKSANVDASKHLLIIKEWGVEIPYNTPDDLGYVMSSTHNAISLSSATLAKQYGCGSATNMFIGRSAGSDYISDQHETVAQAYTKEHNFTKVGNYYYNGGWPADAAQCTSYYTIDANTVSEAKAYIESMIKNIQVIH